MQEVCQFFYVECIYFNLLLLNELKNKADSDDFLYFIHFCGLPVIKLHFRNFIP